VTHAGQAGCARTFNWCWSIHRFPRTLVSAASIPCTIPLMSRLMIACNLCAGTIARTCAAAGVGLHLVGPLGYDIDNSRLKRAGLDYWPYVTVKVHDTWEQFMDYYCAQTTGSKRLLAFSKAGTVQYSTSSECCMHPPPRHVPHALPAMHHCQLLACHRPLQTRRLATLWG
jgi:hypothetical protein